ncbi:transglycosylase family protein [Arthrobacter sp. NPDC090010]|uniref:transglycosylase family protein n=1 Tax=Arthrobacter sp. NPDC090010 TaxID=3363942 RepID=UPI0038194359
MNRIFATDGKFSPVKVGVQIAVVLALVGGLLAFVVNNKTVKINLDGRVSSVQTFGGDVAQVVKSANIDVASKDQVIPSLESSVQDGTEVRINRAKAVDVTLDGSARQVDTHESTVGGLIKQLGVKDSSRVSLPADATLDVQGTTLNISTPKPVTLIVRGKGSKLTTTAATVADVLKEAKVTLGKNDVSALPATAPITPNMTIKVSNVDKSRTAVVKDSIPFDVVKTNAPDLDKGTEKVTKEGVAGSVEKTYRLVIVDGKEATRTLVTSKVVAEPVDQEVKVGTKEAPAPTPTPAAASGGSNTGAAAPAAVNSGMWDRIAQCESTGNWSINTGNGYYGGLQFDIQTWLGAGGGAYAPNASLATREQQIDIANRVYAERGLSPWGCGWAAG